MSLKFFMICVAEGDCGANHHWLVHWEAGVAQTWRSDPWGKRRAGEITFYWTIHTLFSWMLTCTGTKMPRVLYTAILDGGFWLVKSSVWEKGSHPLPKVQFFLDAHCQQQWASLGMIFSGRENKRTENKKENKLKHIFLKICPSLKNNVFIVHCALSRHWEQ